MAALAAPAQSTAAFQLVHGEDFRHLGSSGSTICFPVVGSQTTSPPSNAPPLQRRTRPWRESSARQPRQPPGRGGRKERVGAKWTETSAASAPAPRMLQRTPSAGGDAARWTSRNLRRKSGLEATPYQLLHTRAARARSAGEVFKKKKKGPRASPAGSRGGRSQRRRSRAPPPPRWRLDAKFFFFKIDMISWGKQKICSARGFMTISLSPYVIFLMSC